MKIIGNRIPRNFFTTQGRGESDITIHSGSYHLALKEANIHMANIITYSSILPKIAQENKTPKNITHGEVMETIMAVGHATKGKTATAGIIYGWLYNKKSGEKYGGLVCEDSGNLSKAGMIKKLKASLNELYINGFDDTYNLKDIKILVETTKAKKKFATVLVALCFQDYHYPTI